MKVSRREYVFEGRQGLCDFLEKHCHISGSRDDRVARQFLLSEYAAFCRRNAHPIASTVSIGRFLAKMGVRAGARVGGKKNQKYVYVGIRYNPQDSGTARFAHTQKENSVEERVSDNDISDEGKRCTGKVPAPPTSPVATTLLPVAVPVVPVPLTNTPQSPASPVITSQRSTSAVTTTQPSASSETAPQPLAFPVDMPQSSVSEPISPTFSVSKPQHKASLKKSKPTHRRKSEKGFKGKKELSIYLSQNYELTGKADHKITRPQLYTHYKQFCADNFCHVASIVNVGRFLAKKGVRASARVGGKEGQVYAYVGIKPVLLTNPFLASPMPQIECDVTQIKSEVEEVVVEVDLDCSMHDGSF